jgi:site-specific DNA-cytosine methylase
LQGLPDGWTEYGVIANSNLLSIEAQERGEQELTKISDSARYKALGNGLARPCAEFTFAQINEVEKRLAEIDPLFNNKEEV